MPGFPYQETGLCFLLLVSQLSSRDFVSKSCGDFLKCGISNKSLTLLLTASLVT